MDRSLFPRSTPAFLTRTASIPFLHQSGEYPDTSIRILVVTASRVAMRSLWAPALSTLKLRADGLLAVRSLAFRQTFRHVSTGMPSGFSSHCGRDPLDVEFGGPNRESTLGKRQNPSTSGSPHRETPYGVPIGEPPMWSKFWEMKHS
jgi:hypothetical protein